MSFSRKCLHVGLEDIVYTLETIQFGMSRSTRPEGRYCNTTNRKYTMSQIEQTPEPLLSHQNRLYSTTNSQAHIHLGSVHTVVESESLPLGRNKYAATSHFTPSAQPALQLKVLTLLFKLLTFSPLLKFALTPAQVHNAPGLGRIACRKYLERGFTYGVRWSRAAAAA